MGFPQLLFDPNSNFDELIPVDDFFSDYISQLEAAGGDAQQPAAAVQDQSGACMPCRAGSRFPTVSPCAPCGISPELDVSHHRVQRLTDAAAAASS